MKWCIHLFIIEKSFVIFLLISLDMNIMTFAYRLGHVKVDTTWNTYGHLYPNKRSEVVDKLSALK